MTVHIDTRITDEPLDAARICASVRDDACGAVASFVGVVRNHDSGEAIASIDYSSHPLASDVLQSLAEHLVGRPGVHRIAAWHRIGHLEVGDDAMVVAVSAEHRAQAFGAVEALVEEIKAQLPIWKNQQRSDGSHEWSGMP